MGVGTSYHVNLETRIQDVRLGGKLLDPLLYLTGLKINIKPMFAVC